MQLAPIAPKVPTAAPAAPTPTPVAGPAVPEHDWLDPNVIAARNRIGRVAENTPDVMPPGLAGKGAPSYFRTVDQVNSAIRELGSKFPDLVEVKTIGHSGENRDILAMTITNRKATGDKPIIEHIGGVHAREIANPEMLMTFAKQLVEGYGRDADITNILDTRQVDLVPIVNPDGHVVVEKGFTGAAGGNPMKRKNTVGRDGTDVNRNFDWHWGGPGASSSPSSDTYRGASAGSDPETQAVQSYTLARKPNLFTDWHSYSRLDMYPWGDSRDKAPDYAGLKAVAEKYASFNHYSPEQSIELYPTTGTTDDFAYGKARIPAFAVETGDSFHQSDKEFQATLSENLPVLFWTAKAADDVYHKATAADATDVFVDPQTKAISARIAAPVGPKNAVVAAEAVLDPKAAPGSGLQLGLASAAAGAGFVSATGTLADLPGVAEAKDGQMVYVRAKDTTGTWGPLTAQWLTGPAKAATA
jgi:hypothetical protein